ncbi:Uncharacterized protein BM_BM6967 [Brugia malayi]|uniref:Bm5697 n=1 Tax=Brugia malayi TaxID=6279 RepID=A0A1P6CAU0_BRUMA|nr:Uncharacterized protein BM_BM6967 [Brugia malayi]CRZ24397.1 Bm5697 [Brugia malayi]VIO98494.1 Uncharacterized protein BM_BM6967 [Brugia malayi]
MISACSELRKMVKFVGRHSAFCGEVSYLLFEVLRILKTAELLIMAFTFAAFCYLFALFAVAFCIFFAIFTVICIDELKTEYKNPIEQCNSLNQLVLPEYLLHIILTFLFVLSFQLGGLCWNIPLIAYHIHRYIQRPVMTGPGIYDPTTILNKNELQKALKEGWIKLGFYLISFFYYLYAMIYTMVTSS